MAVLQGINVNRYCSWCHYIDCVPIKWWNCSDRTVSCEVKNLTSLVKMHPRIILFSYK